MTGETACCATDARARCAADSGAQRAGSRHVDGFLAHGERAAAHHAREDRRLHEAERQHHVLDDGRPPAGRPAPRPAAGAGESEEGIDAAASARCRPCRRNSPTRDRAARPARRRSPRPARPTEKRGAAAAESREKHVAAEMVGPHQVIERRVAAASIEKLDLDGIVGRDPGCEGGREADGRAG